MPLCRALGAGLWEIRTSLTGGRIARIMFCVEGGVIILHGFIKKTEKAPQRELNLPRQRQEEVTR
jgi:phage-related protein